jgi:hypothetical protein
MRNMYVTEKSMGVSFLRMARDDKETLNVLYFNTQMKLIETGNGRKLSFRGCNNEFSARKIEV